MVREGVPFLVSAGWHRGTHFADNAIMAFWTTHFALPDARRAGLGVLLAGAALLSGCDQLGIDTPAKQAQRREAEGKAIGAACRHTQRSLEDCYASNPKASKAAIFAGWREMDEYMRENDIPPATPAQSTPAAPPEEIVESSASAGNTASSPNASGAATAGNAARPPGIAGAGAEAGTLPGTPTGLVPPPPTARSTPPTGSIVPSTGPVTTPANQR